MHSERAKILAKVLEYINNDDWEWKGEFLVFGKDAFDIYVGELDGEVTDFDDANRDLVNKTKVNRGERAVAKRISLQAPPKNSTGQYMSEWLERLPNELRVLKESPQARELLFRGPSDNSGNEADALDAALAKEAIRNLDETFARIATFDEMKVGGTPVRCAKYFEEAHRCDLSGFRIASAVLCRAVLEGALIETVGRGSDIGAMIKKADELGKLDMERVAAAKEIQWAGNSAIHDLPTFLKDYAPRMCDLVDNLRKVIIDLYE